MADAAQPEGPVAAVINPFGELVGTAYSFGPTPRLTFSGTTATLVPDTAPPPAVLAALETTVLLDPTLDVPQPGVSVPQQNPPARPQADRGSTPASRATKPQAALVDNQPAEAPDERNWFQKLLNLPQQPAGPALAYARPEEPSTALKLPYGSRTAVYDIAARTVYMPDGEKLEAHSGYGDRLDDIRYVAEKDRGATPPNVYELQLRKDSFHGVTAIRLNPVGNGTMFGRTGILAHPYMLGPDGDSNGCVSIKDYDAFLDAFRRGEVTRLVVVAHQV